MQATLFYLVTYVFMNLGAFAVVAFVRNRTGSEDITVYRGLVHRSPAIVETVLGSGYRLGLGRDNAAPPR